MATLGLPVIFFKDFLYKNIGKCEHGFNLYKNDVSKNCKATLESDKHWVSLSF